MGLWFLYKVIEVNFGFYGVFRKESGYVYLFGVGWEGEFSYFKFLFEVELGFVLLCEIKE